MNVLDANQLKQKLKTNQSPLGKKLFSLAKAIRVCDIRYPVALNKLIYTLYICFRDTFNFILRVLFQTPAFRGRCQNSGKALYLYGGIPFVSGPLSITVGDRCRISGQTTFSASAHTSNPSLIIGSNVGIGWQTTIAVGTKVVIEDNVRIAGRANLFGYSGHPLDARKRAKGEPDDINQIGDIVLKRDCWLGTNCIVKSGVTIGQGAVIASGSVVTEDIPPFVIAAGVPAKVIKYISQETNCEQGGEHA
ncbi:acyltransferase [Vibrio comitans]|uniref:Acetyltransferase n=1 Tax=Vibrio comitans NBRC 102076 TaxID=1219078 RepID=A0A4Y3IKU5_9VIBR|nr:acyltransferase [Vibrio comitans]GEA59370.1 acetyltransferase [Vibrio comitans NBRC 102076]